MAPFLTKFALKFGVDGNSSQLSTWCAAVVVTTICVYVTGFMLTWFLPAKILSLKVIRPFLSRRKKDEVRVILKCDLSAWQKAWYTRVTDEARDGLGRKKRLQNLTVQLRKVCNHPYLFLEQHYPEWNENIFRSSGKFELLDRLLPKLHRAGHRVLIFSQMTKCMTILGDYLRLKGYQFLRLDGITRAGDMDELFEQFNAPDSPYFIFIQSGRHGLDLHTADTIIMFDSDWNPQMKEQVDDCARRDGQTKKVKVFVLVSIGSVEEVILNRAKHTAEERREILVEIIRKGANALGGEVPSEREINQLAARSDEEFRLFEKMDEERRQRENNGSRLMEEHEVKMINDLFGVY